MFTGKTKMTVEILAQKTGKKLLGNPNYKILGPSPAPIEKIHGNWRTHLIIKTNQRCHLHIFDLKCKNMNSILPLYKFFS